MPLIETLAIEVGSSIAKLILKLWLKDSDTSKGINSNILDVVKTQTTDTIAQRQAVRQFEAIGERVGESLFPLFTSSDSSLNEDDYIAVALAIQSTFDSVTGEVLTQNYLAPSSLTRHLLTTHPPEKYSFRGEKAALYRRVIAESCEYLVDVAAQLPMITYEQSLADILKRETQILTRTERLLQELQRTREQLSLGKQTSRLEEGAKLQYLKLVGVGPLKQAELTLTSRLNLITGDNALGKTFLLECAWWTLTGNWTSTYPVVPRQDTVVPPPSITFRIGKKSNSNKAKTLNYDWDKLEWNTPAKRNVLPSLSIYAQNENSYMVWDPAKLLLAEENPFFAREGSKALTHFSLNDIWNGISENNQGITRTLCNGLIQDWVYWQNDQDKTRFDEFTSILRRLSPHPTEPLVPGEPIRMPFDARTIPTLQFSYGDVPVTLCSSGIQHIIALAYLLVWAWSEHTDTSRRRRKDPQRSITLLIDEIETHLHPAWQRTIIPALLDIVQTISKETQTQLIIATHSPLVLASVEPFFDEEKDALFHLYIKPKNGQVQLDKVPFVKMGRVDQWLVSDLFGLGEPRSKDAEMAIEDAREVQLQEEPPLEKVQEISDRLVRVLAAEDEFWPTWVYFAKQRGVRFDARRNAS